MRNVRNFEGETPRVLTAMVTPFRDNGKLNGNAAQELAAYLIDHGSDGLVLAGTTGESPTLRVKDQLSLFQVVREAVGSNVPLLGGTGSNSTEEAAHLTRQATADKLSLNGILAVSPYYNRPSQHGIDHYYRAIAEATDLPITLYNIPARTGRLVEEGTISELVEDGIVHNLKDATGNTEMARALHQRFGDDLTIYSGDDSLNLAFAREAGAVGAISVASHWAGRPLRQMFDAYFSGDLHQAAQLETILGESYQFESVHTDEQGRLHDTPNPIPTKVMMAHILGRNVIGDCLPPMTASPEEMNYLRHRAPQILASLARLG